MVLIEIQHSEFLEEQRSGSCTTNKFSIPKAVFGRSSHMKLVINSKLFHGFPLCIRMKGMVLAASDQPQRWTSVLAAEWVSFIKDDETVILEK